MDGYLRVPRLREVNVQRELTYFCYASRVGHVTIAASRTGIALLRFGNEPVAGAKAAPCPLTNLAATQIQEYFAGKRRSFDLPLDTPGSDFQRSVWEAVRLVPYGEALTAREVAQRIGRAQSERAVGSALLHAPTELLIPLHRVVSATGRPRGTGSDAQRHAQLLAFERAQLERAADGQHEG